MEDKSCSGRDAGGHDADRGVPGAAASWRSGAEPGAAGARGGQGRRRRRRPADLPGDVPHRLRHRPAGGAPRWPSLPTGRRRRGPPGSRRAAGIALLYGYPERGEEAASTTPRSCSTATGNGSRTTARRTCSATLDRDAFAPGQRAADRAELDGLKIGILICYDVEFPENVRRLALPGADLVAVPTAQMQPFAFVVRALVPARAYENQMFLAYANRCGREGELDYLGQSCIVGPDGVDLARAGAARS